MYIFEAAFEYLISILVTGSFLATITKEIGISDSLTGILSSVISLGCFFQLLSLSVRKSRVKKLVLVLSVVNQALFMMLYVIPLTGAKKQIKVLLFVVLVCLAYIIYNLAHPKKINWLMSLVDDSNRGSFTSNKEIFSLVLGMLFSFSMGALIDRFAASGNIRTAFILSAAVIFILMLLHTITMIFTVEKETDEIKSTNLITSLKELFKNKSIFKIIVVFILYYISTYASVPFYGTYQINELGLSLKVVSILVMLGNVSRILVSRFWGKYADRKSFAMMMEKCLMFLGAAQLCALFAVPSNGVIMFALYYFFFGIAMGGINSALINLIFDYVPFNQRSDSLAITHAVSGIVGFLTTLCLSSLVSYVQNNGNIVFDVHIYAQQICTLISLFFTAVAIVYVRSVIINKRKNA
ncbi:MAG: MFS transporter [Eubacteriales bacterium]|nr:MFS transporter [Eubacteriales bacterium]